MLAFPGVAFGCGDPSREYGNPAWVLRVAGDFLASEPVLHNLILTLLRERVANPEPGRYWVATESDAAVGMVFQSPLGAAANLTPMEPAVTRILAESIAQSAVDLPGVSGEAATAARFAGHWTECRDSAAVPVKGQRLYELVEPAARAQVGGRLRRAVPADRDVVVNWVRRFFGDIGERRSDTERVVDRRLAAGMYWLWEDPDPVSLATHSDPVAGVVRVQGAYTPPDLRNRGYGGACVGGLSELLLGSGYRTVLYTDLGNPISNKVFRRLGFHAVAEVLRYQFT